MTSKLTLWAGLVAAIAAAVAAINIDPVVTKIALGVNAVAIAVLGVVAKDYNMTGGTKINPADITEKQPAPYAPRPN